MANSVGCSLLRGLIGGQWRGLLLLLPVWLSPPVLADQPLFPHTDFRGDFQQRIFLPNGLLSSESSGEFALMAPHYLRWQTLDPGRQLLLVDGEFLWQYDQDLETLSRHAVADLDAAPLELLLAPKSLIFEQYTLTEDANSVTLVPKAEQATFQALTIETIDNRPQKLTITDNLGQRVEIMLKIAPDDSPTQQDFVWQMPEGVELLGSEFP